MTELEAATSRIQRLFGELRDQLLAASHESAKSEKRDWAQAEHFFSASKKVDELCRSVLRHMSEAGLNDSASSSPETNGTTSAPYSRQRTSKRNQKKDYPKYSVRSDALVKVGLSRDRRTEYEHTVPRIEFDAIVGRLGELAGRRHFAAEDVIEKVPSPSYQVYIVLSLLKERGLLVVPHRGVYAFSRPKSFTSESESVWSSLAQD